MITRAHIESCEWRTPRTCGCGAVQWTNDMQEQDDKVKARVNFDAVEWTEIGTPCKECGCPLSMSYVTPEQATRLFPGADTSAWDFGKEGKILFMVCRGTCEHGNLDVREGDPS